MPPAVVALAPVVASAVGQIAKHKQAKSAEKKALAYEAETAKAAEAAKAAEFEASQGSPAALAQRQKFTFQLGKLLGKAGGKDKIPPSIYNYLQSQRQPGKFTPGPAYVPKPESGAGIWDIVGGAGEALSYLNTGGLGSKTPNVAENLAMMGRGLGAARQGGLGALQTGGLATSPTPGLATSLTPWLNKKQPGTFESPD